MMTDTMVYLDRVSSPAVLNETTRKLEESTPYGITYVKAEEVSDANSGSIKVCIVDSGYDLSHPDLPKGDSVTGESFVDGYAWSTDENGHGTHVAGTIAAIGGNNKGVKGVIRNGNVKLHIAKVFDESGAAPISETLTGLDSCIRNGANVVNMSLGSGSSFPLYQSVINDGYNNGMLIFASSGNSGSDDYNYPGSYDNVISVASIDSSYTRSSFSTFNDMVDIAAPGSNVESTIPGGGYAFLSGTSMACPHAAGVAALVWSTYPSLSHETLENILESTAEDLPLDSPDGYDILHGHGLINAKAAFDEVQKLLAPTMSPAPSSTPSEFCVDGIEAVVKVFTDRYYPETSWDFKDASGTVVASGGDDYSAADTLYVDTICLDKTEACGGVDYSFTIYDSFGDGICCGSFKGNGYYNVYVEDDLKASGGVFEFSETTPICKATVSTVPSSSPSSSAVPSSSPSSSDVPSSTPSEFCVDGIEAVVEVFTDRYYPETSWDFKDASGTVVASGGDDYSAADTLYVDTICLDKTEACGGVDYSFTIYDSFGDGICCGSFKGNGYYNVYVEDDLKASGGVFEFSETTPICKCFENTTRKACNGEFGCVWEKEGEGGGSCTATADECDKTKKRKPCLAIDGCFWKTTGEGTGRCKVCSSLAKKNACVDQGCIWEDSMCK